MLICCNTLSNKKLNSKNRVFLRAYFFFKVQTYMKQNGLDFFTRTVVFLLVSSNLMGFTKSKGIPANLSAD